MCSSLNNHSFNSSSWVTLMYFSLFSNKSSLLLLLFFLIYHLSHLWITSTVYHWVLHQLKNLRRKDTNIYQTNQHYKTNFDFINYSYSFPLWHPLANYYIKTTKHRLLDRLKYLNNWLWVIWVHWDLTDGQSVGMRSYVHNFVAVTKCFLWMLKA